LNKTMRLIVVMGLAVIALLVLIPLLIMAGMMGGMGMMGGGLMNGGMMGGMGMTLLGLLFLLLVLAGVALLVIWAVRRSGGGLGSGREDPMEILRARYARGEVGCEEFERMREDLARTSSTREELPR